MSALIDGQEPTKDMAVHVDETDLKNTYSVIQGSISTIHIDPELEKQTLRKFDKFLLPQLAILVIVAYLDRSNIGEYLLHLVSFELTLARKCKNVWLCSRPTSDRQRVQ
jgi:hypothetical protein